MRQSSNILTIYKVDKVWSIRQTFMSVAHGIAVAREHDEVFRLFALLENETQKWLVLLNKQVNYIRAISGLKFL